MATTQNPINNLPLTIVATGNTTGATSSGTLDMRSVSISGLGIASVGFSGSNIVISASSLQSQNTEGWSAIGNTTGSTSSTAFNSNFSLSGAGAVSVGYSGNSIIISAASAGATQSWSAVGNTTASTSSTSFGTGLSISGTGGVSVGFSGQTVVISGPGAGGAGATLSKTIFPEGIYAAASLIGGGGGGISSNAWASGNAFVQYCPLQNNLSISSAGVFLNILPQTSAAASTGSWSATLVLGLYTLNGTSLSAYFSSSGAASCSWSSSLVANTGLITGLRLLSIPFATSLPPNEYWCAAVISTATGANLSATQSIGFVLGVANYNNFGRVNDGNSVNKAGQGLFLGVGSTALAASTLPASMAATMAGVQGANYILEMANYSVT